jgi:hypothetical protein
MVQFKLEDITFFHQNELGQGWCLPRDAPFEQLLAAEGATLKLNNQKNGWKGVCVYQQHNGEPLQCLVRALARRVIDIQKHNAVGKDYLSAYFVDGACKDVTAEDISKHLKLGRGCYTIPHKKELPSNGWTHTRYGGGGANALALLGFLDTQIQKMGCWRGATFKEYIREELPNHSDGMSMAMKTKFNFMNVSGNAFRDIMDTVMSMEYNTEFVLAAAA